jgi:putative transcriptional regulator
MTNHPGRKPGSEHPDPALIKDIRGGVGQTQTEAAETVHGKLRTWQDWESGKRAMPLAAWELYLLHHVATNRLCADRIVRQWARPELLAFLAP